jgi:hypothetical protein
VTATVRLLHLNIKKFSTSTTTPHTPATLLNTKKSLSTFLSLKPSFGRTLFGAKNMAFNPPLGSTNADVFMDNVQRLDELINGPAADVPDRAGDPLYSWRLIRQSLIPLSRQYMTLADAQADIANIPDGSATYVRSTDDSALADEYINNGGTLEATGRRMPSQVYIDSLLSIIQQMQNQSLYRDGVAGFSFPVISADKRVIGFKNDGGVYVADVEIPGTDKIPPRDGPQYISVVKSKNDGRVGIGFNPKTA